MAKQVTKYTISNSPAAERDLRKLRKNRIVLESIDKTILGLAGNPRPPGAIILSGNKQYRVRDGEYRVLYEVDDAARQVLIMRVRDRKDVYRN